MKIKQNNDWEVLTATGWKGFSAVSTSTVPVHVKITFTTGQQLLCSPTHKIKNSLGKFVDAIDVQSGEQFNGLEVVSVDILYDELEVFDLKGVDGEEYITNGIISHNCAFIDDADIIWTAASSTLSTGGKAILLSTPNGVGNFFHKMWQQAESKENNFNPILLDWRVHPERDQAWRDRQTELMGELQASQEHDASFIFSGNTVIPPEIIEFYKTSFVQEPINKGGFDGNLWIWEYPVPGKSYIVCADVSRGDGEDYSTFHVIDVESSIQVAEYKGKVETKQFGNMLVAISTEYNDALLIPDNSSIGWNAIQQVIDRGYKNLFYMSRDLQYVDVEHQMVGNYRKEEKGMVPGFMISQRTRPLIISRLKEYMLENSFTIRSSRTTAELETFIWKNGRPEALQGYNDDLVMALCIGLWVRDTALRLRQEGIELTKLALDKTNYKVEGMVYTNNHLKRNPYEMQIGNKTENISWLLG